MNYIIYKTNGQIVRNVSTSDVEGQLGLDEKYLEGCADDSRYYVDNNGIVVEIPANPGPEYFVFDYDSKTWVDPLPPEKRYSMECNKVLTERNKLLYQSDWTQIPNNPLPFEKQQEWNAYRQQLRDITTQENYPYKVDWPIQPN